MGYYDTAQVCMNGHCITGTTSTDSNRLSDYCPNCGAKTITKCPHCSADIRGEYHVDGVGLFAYTPTAPKYCHNCGNAYPWTEAEINATADVIQLDNSLSEEEKQQLVNSLPDLISETPKTKIAILLFKKSLSVVGKVTREAVTQFITNIGCELVKKMLLGE